MDFNVYDEFNIENLKLNKDIFEIIQASHENEDEANYTKKSFKLKFFMGTGADNIKLKQVIEIMNKTIKKYRTNRLFGEEVRDNFYKDFKLKKDKSSYWKFMKGVSRTLELKDKIDQGLFD